MSSKSNEKKSSGRPWRDNIEAVTVSIITIVLFKYFVLEAYKIPTGSMQPTLMGNTETGIFDRVLVDKFSPHYRELERFEVVVFKYPLNQAQNFIKRIVGMPGEELKIVDGDVWVRPNDAPRTEYDDGWRALQRPRPIQNTQLRRLNTAEEWRFEGQGWSADDGTLVAPGPGRAEYPRTMTSIRDGYTDGYPKGLVSKIDTRMKRSASNDVSDLRTTATVRADAETTEVRIVLREGKRRFRFILPGPAAKADARPTLEAFDPSGEMVLLTSVAPEPWRLRSGKGIDVLAQNLDDLLTLELEGGPTLTLPVPPSGSERTSSVAFELDGAGARIEDVEVFRDIFYTTIGQRVTHWTIPEGSYVMLGDNSQDSSDGRDWHLAGIRVLDGPDKDQVVRGNDRQRENPRWVDGSDGGQVFFRDELGELHWYPTSEVESLSPIPAPLVPLGNIIGRAVLVVWPMSPKYDVYRLKWVR
ncbi:MAG: signal peptidase I [Planctomycetota bacterium]